MERPIFKPIGTAVEELDTPALVVDLDALESNIECVHSVFRGTSVRLRPNVERHRCPAIAHMQLAVDGCADGVCVSSVSEAEAMAQHGITDVLVGLPMVTPSKIRRLCALARRGSVSVAVDDSGNAQMLSDAAQSAGVNIDVFVSIRASELGAGVQAGAHSAELANAVGAAGGLRFAGLLCMDAGDPDADEAETRRCVQRVLDTRELLERQGVDVPSVSVGGGRCIAAADMSGVTEVVAGSYALMDGRHRDILPDLRQAAGVLASVTSLPEPGVAILDTGRKAMGEDYGFPAVAGNDALEVASMSAEHGKLQWRSDADVSLAIGGKVWFTPADIGGCVNVYDYMHGVRSGRLETALDISARGLYR